MTSIFSAISGQFSKSLTMGTFLPVVLFVVLGLLSVPPLLPPGSDFLQPLHALDKEWQIVAVTFVTILLTGILYNLNVPIIRMYEGYPWSKSWLGKWRTRVWQSRFECAQRQRTRLRFLSAQIAKSAPESPLLSEVRDKQQAMSLMLNREFPGSKSLILSTHLGNVIRCFEYYPSPQYGMDAISLWPRLIAKIDKDYAAVIDEAKASFDFMINCSALSALSAASLLFFGFRFAMPLESAARLELWVAEWLGFAVLSWIFYRWSVGRAAAWGAQVKGAFDLFRHDLLAQLGYNYKPNTRVQERKMWLAISQQVMYGDPPAGADACLPYSPPEVQATVVPATVAVNVSKGVTPAGPDHPLRVTLRIRNIGQSIARRITLSDSFPAGFSYVWDSLTVSEGRATLVASSPLTFQLENVPPAKDLLLSYAAISLAFSQPDDNQVSGPSKEAGK